MSDRERWIIYPLLFFSFALAIRDQWPSTGIEPTDFNVLNCQHLVVRDAEGNVAVDINARNNGKTKGAGAIVIYGPANDGGASKPAAVRLFVAERQPGLQDLSGVVETLSPLGSREALIAGNSTGGVLYLFDAASNVRAAIPPIRVVRTQPPATDEPRQAVPKPPMP